MEPHSDRRKVSGRCKGADVEFINYGLFPRAPLPVLILPVETFGIDDLAGGVNVARLKAGGGIAHFLPLINTKTILCARLVSVGDQFKPPLVLRLQSKSVGALRARQQQ